MDTHRIDLARVGVQSKAIEWVSTVNEESVHGEELSRVGVHGRHVEWVSLSNEGDYGHP